MVTKNASIPLDELLFLKKMSFSKKQRIIFLFKRTKMLEPGVGPHAKQRGKIMKVQAVKELTLSVLWVGTLSILVFLTQWNAGGFV